MTNFFETNEPINLPENPTKVIPKTKRGLKTNNPKSKLSPIETKKNGITNQLKTFLIPLILTCSFPNILFEIIPKKKTTITPTKKDYHKSFQLLSITSKK